MTDGMPRMTENDPTPVTDPTDARERRPWVPPTLTSRPLYEQLATTCPLRFQTGKPS